jgi:HEAT repeat protein
MLGPYGSVWPRPPLTAPVEALRDALRLETGDLLRQDPTLSRRHPGPKNQVDWDKILNDARVERISKCAAALQSLPEMRDALLLQEWREGSEPVAVEDQKQRAILADRFAKEMLKVLKTGKFTSRLAALTLLAESGRDLSVRDAKGTLRNILATALFDMVKGPEDPPVREAAIHATGRMFLEPRLVVPLLDKLMDSQSLPDRRAATAALVDLVRTASELRDPVHWSVGLPAQRADVVQVSRTVLPVAGRGLGDADRNVRSLCCEAIRESALALANEAQRTDQPQQPMTDVNQDPAAAARELDRAHDQLLPLAEALSEQTPKLRVLVNDSQLEALDSLEAVAEARLKMRPLHEAGEKPAKREPDELLAEGLRPTLPALIEQLKAAKQDVRLRLGVLYVLETLEDEAAPAAEAVAGALADADPFVRWGAARTLGKMAPRQAEKSIPALARAVDDPNGDVRSTALAALRRYGPAAQPAVENLVKGLKHWDPQTRLSVAETLGAVGPAAVAAVQPLAAALAGEEPEQRAAAARALGKLGPGARPAEEALRKALSDPERDVRQAACDALLIINK